MKPQHGRWKPYPAYKPSGVEWLREVPTHWMSKRLRFTCLINPSKSEVTVLSENTEVTFLPMEAIGTDGTIDIAESRMIVQLQQGYTYFRDDDVIVAKITPCFENGKGAICKGLRSGIGFGTTELQVLRPRVNIISPFLFYLSKSHPFRNLGIASMKGVAGQQRITDDFLKDFVIALPSLQEQQAIAAFLDRETAKIDTLVAKKERLIELLQEKRTALISHAVTRGLDPNVPMKNSGVEWLGEIPEHWDVARIKWSARMVSGHTPDKKVESYWLGGDIPWVSLADTGQLREVDYIASTATMTTSDGIAHSSAHVLPTGTVVFSRDATIGLCAITRTGMAVSQHFIGWVCGSRLRPEYLLFVLRSMTQDLERLTMGATIRTIGMPDVRSLVAPIPPEEEQEKIVLHVRQQRTKVDNLVAKVHAAVDRLQEYRTALISAAVMGKIDVRGSAA